MVHPPASLLTTLTGTDRQGVTAAVLEALAGRGLEVLDVQQHVVRGRLTLALLTTAGPDPDAAADALRAAAAPFDLEVATSLAPAGGPSAGERSHVAVLGAPLRPEQLARVARAVSDAGASIEAVRRLATAVPEHPVTCLELDVLHAPALPPTGATTGTTTTATADLRRALSAVAAATGVDVAVSPAGLVRHGRRLVVLDVDSTLIQDEVIDLIAAHAGPQAQRAVAEVTERAMRGELDFAASLHERVAALAGLDARVLAEVRASVRLTPGAVVLCTVLQRLGFVMALVSGGFAEVVEPLAASLGIARVRANRLEVADGRLTGRVSGPVVDRAAKAAALREFADAEQLPLERTVAVGDGANDLDMLAAAGLGVAFNAKPLVREQADAAITTPYLDSVLHLLGISREEADEVRRPSTPGAGGAGTGGAEGAEGAGGPVALRPLRRDDLPLVSRWLSEPRVARWWDDDPSPEAVAAQYGPSIDGDDATEVFVALTHGGRPFGLVQRYRYDDEPASRDELAALLPVPPGALGVDYLVGEPDLQGRGLGAALVAAVVTDGWLRHPDAREVLVPVAAGNRASWRALEKAGFTLAATGPLRPDNPLDPPEHVVYRIGRPHPWPTGAAAGGMAP